MDEGDMDVEEMLELGRQIDQVDLQRQAPPPPTTPRDVYDEVTFVHTWKVDRASEGWFGTTFCTSFGAAPVIHRWYLRLIDTSVGVNGKADKYYQMQLLCTQAFVRKAEAPPAFVEVEFILESENASGENEIAPVRYRIQHPQWQNGIIRVPMTSDFGETLINILANKKHQSKTVRIVTKIHVEKKWFVPIIEFRKALLPDPYPKQFDFRFATLHDKSRHDFTIVCRDGRVTCSKEQMYGASPYFRTHFSTNEGGASSELAEDASVIAVNKTLTFMVTATFEPSTNGMELKISDAEDIEKLVVRYKVMHSVKIRRALQQEMMRLVTLRYKDLDFLVRVYLFSINCALPLYRLEALCLSYLVDKHANQIVLDYGKEGTNARRNEIHHRLMANEGKAMNLLNRIREQLIDVRCYERRIKQ